MSGAAATSLGNKLRQERLQRNLTLPEISTRTRICTAILEAMENDRFDSIPGGWYRQSFLRQYARALELDGEALVAEFKTEYAEPPLPLPNPPRRKRRRIWADVAWAAVCVLCLLAIYETSIAKDAQWRRPAETFPRKQPPSLAIAPATAVPVIPKPTQASEPTAPAPAPTAQEPGVHIAIKATEPVWLSIKCDGDVKYTGVLEGPETKTFDAGSAITATIGNAGGLEISLNGRPVGPLGAHGEVQTLELTAAGARRIAHHPDQL